MGTVKEWLINKQEEGICFDEAEELLSRGKHGESNIRTVGQLDTKRITDAFLASERQLLGKKRSSKGLFRRSRGRSQVREKQR